MRLSAGDICLELMQEGNRIDSIQIAIKVYVFHSNWKLTFEDFGSHEQRYALHLKWTSYDKWECFAWSKMLETERVHRKHLSAFAPCMKHYGTSILDFQNVVLLGGRCQL